MDSCLDYPDLSLHTQPDPDRRVWHFNVAFIGNCRVGKTKLLQRFVDSQFSDIYSQTVETSFVSKSVSIGRHHVVFQCWDTPGSARSSGSLDQRLAQLHAIFIVLDASRDAIADLKHWDHVAARSARDDTAKPLLVLVANKSDLGCHEGTMTQARKLALARGGLVFALSVLSDEENLEVDAMMLEVGKALTERHAREVAANAAASSTVAPAVPAVMPQVGEDRERPLETPKKVPPFVLPKSVSQQGSNKKTEFADLADGAAQEEGEGGTLAASIAIVGKAEGDGYAEECRKVDSKSGDNDAGKSWWLRAVCCCSCWSFILPEK